MNSRWKNGRCSMNETERQCMEYFRSSQIFRRLFEQFLKKYQSYGEFAGNASVRFKTEEEREALEGFMQRNYHGKKSASVSAAAFEKALSESRFSDMDGKHILELFFSHSVTGKKEEQKKKEKRWENIVGEAENLCFEQKREAALFWIKEIKIPEQDKSGFRGYIRKRGKEAGDNDSEVIRLFELGIRIISEFSDRQEKEQGAEYLPVFAARLTGNPHAFDDGKKDGQYLNMLVNWWNAFRGLSSDETGIFPAVQKKKNYLEAGLIRDEVSNYAMLCGICAEKKNGQIHQGTKEFAREGDMIQVPLAVLTGWKAIHCVENRIYIVENPSIYAKLCELWKGKKSVMCMNGQPRLSAVLVMDLLKQSGTDIYYSGDFDPEGLLIAQKIKSYYGGNVHFWNMTKEDYYDAESEEDISEKRLSTLSHLTDPELLDIAAEIQKVKKAGYQENIWEKYR